MRALAIRRSWQEKVTVGHLGGSMKFLFITSRNVINTCGELRLIKNRALALHAQHGVVTDFLVFRSKKCLNKPREPIGGGSTLTEFLFNAKNPFTYLSRRAALKKECDRRIASGEYDVVILSGMLAFGLAKRIKKRFPEVKLVFDMHGAIEELIEFGAGGAKGIAKRILYKLMKGIERRSVPHADGIMAVSHALKDYVITQYGAEDKQYFIIPCAQGKAQLCREQIDKNRAIYREKYGIADDDILFVYSGGLSAWQCTDQSVELFKAVKAQIPNAKMLFLTGNTAAVKAKYADAGVIVDSVSPDLVNDVLCAGDYAFMIREPSFTNLVAYPNKFIEYVSSGMKIVATESVADVAEQIKRYDVGVILGDNRAEELISAVSRGYTRLADLEARNALLDDVCFENRIIPLVEFAGK